MVHKFTLKSQDTKNNAESKLSNYFSSIQNPKTKDVSTVIHLLSFTCKKKKIDHAVIDNSRHERTFNLRTTECILN